jgi:type 1 glutamine amidotransferase
MLGGEFIAHGAQQEALQHVVSPNFPGAKKLERSFRLHEEFYGLKNFSRDLHVILTQETKGMKGEWYQRPPYPSTWARMHEQGRVFYTALGHREDVWTNELFQQIVLGGLSWILKEIDADVTPNIEKVTPHAYSLRRKKTNQ